MQGVCHIAAVRLDTTILKPKSGMFTRWWAVIKLEYRLPSVADDAAWAI